MTDVKVPISTENAILLLASAEELGLGPSVVRTISGSFVVPEEVNEKAFGEPEPDKAPAKKAAAKKSTAAKKSQE